MSSDAMAWSHQAQWTAEPVNIAKARQFVCWNLDVHQLPELVDEVRVVAGELATNAVLHARTPFCVTLAQIGDLVLLAVRDGSPHVLSSQRPAVSSPRGRGLYMVDAYSNAWGVTSEEGGGKSVWATFATGACHTNLACAGPCAGHRQYGGPHELAEAWAN